MRVKTSNILAIYTDYESDYTGEYTIIKFSVIFITLPKIFAL